MVKKDIFASEDTGFYDRSAVKTRRPKEMPTKESNSPWNFSAPCYDQRSSNFVNAGTHYGVGTTQPVGHEGNPKTTVRSLPHGRVDTLRDDEKG